MVSPSSSAWPRLATAAAASAAVVIVGWLLTRRRRAARAAAEAVDVVAGAALDQRWTKPRAAERQEVSAGVCLVRPREGSPRTLELLLVRTRNRVAFEVPKGHVEAGETVVEAALRELREETGLLSAVGIDSFLRTDEYKVLLKKKPVMKRVHFFRGALAERSGAAEFGPREPKFVEVRWAALHELERDEGVPIREGHLALARQALAAQ